jgi:hypothetical protein
VQTQKARVEGDRTVQVAHLEVGMAELRGVDLTRILCRLTLAPWASDAARPAALTARPACHAGSPG